IADRLREPPERAAIRRVRHAGHLAEPRDDAHRERERDRDRCPPYHTLLVEARERVRELLLRFLAEALQRAQLVLAEDAPEIVDRRHTQLGAELLHRLGAEPLDAKESDHARRVLLPEQLELLDFAGVAELADLLRRAFADAVDLLELLHRERGEVARLGGDRL